MHLTLALRHCVPTQMAVAYFCCLFQATGVITAPGVTLGPRHRAATLFLSGVMAIPLNTLIQRNDHAGSP